MAIPTNIKTLLSGNVVEWARIEYKEAWDAKASLKTVCAFANDRIHHEAELSDLNITLVQSYLREVKSSLYEKSKTADFAEICSDMNIISNLPEYVKPKNVGLMFFCLEPDKFFPYAQIDVVLFPGGLGGNDIIEQTFKGSIHQQLREALQYIRNMVITEKIIKYPERAEADCSVTMEGLKRYRVSNRRYRNRRIGDFLKELHLTEGRNTGFKKILDALAANGSPKPEFETDDDRSYFITRLFIHEGFLKEENEMGTDIVSYSAPSTPNPTPNSTPSTPFLVLREEPAWGMPGEGRAGFAVQKELEREVLRKRMLSLMRECPTISKKEMTGLLGVSMYALKKELSKMHDEHVAEFVGFSRNGKWVVY